MAPKSLTKAQRQHLERLMTEIKNAEVAAQRFLGYCASEAEIEIGQEGWQFNLDEMAFEQEKEMPLAPVNDVMRAEIFPSLPGARNGDRHA